MYFKFLSHFHVTFIIKLLRREKVKDTQHVIKLFENYIFQITCLRRFNIIGSFNIRKLKSF